MVSVPPPPSGRLANRPSRQRAERTNRHPLINKPTRAKNGGLRSTQPTLPDGGNRRLNHPQAQSRLLGRVEGRMEPVRGQDDRKRERHARDGVWLPAGEERPGARGFPDSRHTRKAWGQGGGPFAPLPPPPTAGWQIAPADGAETDQPNQSIKQRVKPLRQAQGERLGRQLRVQLRQMRVGGRYVTARASSEAGASIRCSRRCTASEARRCTGWAMVVSR